VPASANRYSICRPDGCASTSSDGQTHATADAVTEFATPYRNRTFELLEERGELESILAKGADRAREVASATLADAYDKVGLV